VAVLSLIGADVYDGPGVKGPHHPLAAHVDIRHREVAVDIDAESLGKQTDPPLCGRQAQSPARLV